MLFYCIQEKVWVWFIIFGMLGYVPSIAGLSEEEKEVPFYWLWLRRISGFESGFEEIGRKREGQSLIIPLQKGKKNEFFVRLRDRELALFEGIKLTVKLHGQGSLSATVFVKDWDLLWYGHFYPLWESDTSYTLHLPLQGEAAQTFWTPSQHFRPWHSLTHQHLYELGIKVELQDSEEINLTHLEILAVQGIPALSSTPEKIKIQNWSVTPRHPKVGEILEICFSTNAHFTQPFDRDQAKVNCQIKLPSTQEVLINGFYYEDFLWDQSHRNSRLVPYNKPEWRIRFLPTEPGEHHFCVQGKFGNQSFLLPPFSLKVQDNPSWKGKITKKQDSPLLFFERTQEELLGIGMNMRSPYDTRYRDVFPATKWEPWNLKLYSDLFHIYEKAGINVIEVWLASWWLAPEWIPDARGNHGIGWFNQERLWLLDMLFSLASQHRIYIILAIHNHGKFSTFCDREWDRNPFFTGNGGYLSTPEEFFSSEQAWKDYQRFIDYLIARYAAQPNLLCWKLFTEIDLTGSQGNWFKSPQVTQWHRKASSYIRSIDIYQHLVTTHWSGNYSKSEQSPQLASLPELDILTLDAYYGGILGCQHFYSNMIGTIHYQNRINKPCIITEFGGTPWADILPQLYQQIQLALWISFFGKLPVTPALWWFPLVEEHNLYPYYESFYRFARGEPRENLIPFSPSSPPIDGLTLRLIEFSSPSPTPSKQRASANDMEMWCLVGENRMLGWIFNRTYYLNNYRLVDKSPLSQELHLYFHVDREANPTKNLLSPGKYRIEFWNCLQGKVISNQEFLIKKDGKEWVFPIPLYQEAIAFKIIKDG